MKIVYILGPTTIRHNNGIKKQAEIWRNALIEKGHNVFEYSPWNIPNWKNIDIIHIFGNGLWLIDTVKLLKEVRKPIILSPILDTYKPVGIYKLISFNAIPKLRLFSLYYVLRAIKNDIDGFLVRSDHEKRYILKAYGVENDKIYLLRLPCRIVEYEDPKKSVDKVDYCLHVSPFTQRRKNVMKLMQAAVKYNFPLKIVGSPGSIEESQPFYDYVSNHDNIELLGTVSDEKLISLYDEAKVFALPSYDEGVGFVALEAAARKCNIVLTNVGGPKEYYDGMAELVNPHSIDDIGMGVLKALKKPTDNQLASFIKKEYNIQTNCKKLLEIYSEIIEKYRKI